MNAHLHRALVAFTGMPDSMATPNESRMFDEDVAPDATRVIQAPKRTPEDDAYLARVRRWTLLVVTTGMATLAGLLELFGAPPLLP